MRIMKNGEDRVQVVCLEYAGSPLQFEFSQNTKVWDIAQPSQKSRYLQGHTISKGL